MSGKKNLEIVSGNGSNLDISPVYDHLTITKPKSVKDKPTDIVIPKEKTQTSASKKNKKSSAKK